MALLDDIKVFVRSSGTALDVQWQVLCDAALADMLDKGVDPDLLTLDAEGNLKDSQVKHAVALYCQANSGFDNDESDRFMGSYLAKVCHLMAHHNIREKTEPEPEPEPEPDPEQGSEEG